jgi:hypothetical protein
VTASQLTALVVLFALCTALAASMNAALPNCSAADILTRAGNNAAMAISYLGEES